MKTVKNKSRTLNASFKYLIIAYVGRCRLNMNLVLVLGLQKKKKKLKHTTFTNLKFENTH